MWNEMNLGTMIALASCSTLSKNGGKPKIGCGGRNFYNKV
jgi:hypothetical protein